MSKVIIDGHLIDLEMILYIVQPHKTRIDLYPEAEDEDPKDAWAFGIVMVGMKKLVIYRTYSHQTSEGAKYAITKMYTELAKRWSPAMTKFDDLTVY